MTDDAEMLEAVEQWARATRRWVHSEVDDGPPADHRWFVAGGERGLRVVDERLQAWPVAPHPALVWALAEETLPACRCCRGRGTVDEWVCESFSGAFDERSSALRRAGYRVEWFMDHSLPHWEANRPVRVHVLASRSRPCGACSGTGRFTVDVGRCQSPHCEGGLEHRTVRIMGPEIGSLLEDEGWERTCDPYNTGKGAIPWAIDLRRTCPDCTGSGRDRREVGRLLLDAQPQWVRGEDHGRHGAEPARCDGPGDPASIEALTVLADQLQARGESLGFHIAHLLAGVTDGTADAVAALQRATEARLDRPGKWVETELDGLAWPGDPVYMGIAGGFSVLPSGTPVGRVESVSHSGGTDRGARSTATITVWP